MTNVVESLPARMRELFAQVIGARDPVLLMALTSHEVPTASERRAVENILADEFSGALREDWEPTDRGRQIDEMIGEFLLRWPISG